MATRCWYYNEMGVAKAVLEDAVRYIAAEAGPDFCFIGLLMAAINQKPSFRKILQFVP